MRWRIVIETCPHGVPRLTSEDSSGGGTAFLGAHCAGPWRSKYEWDLTPVAAAELSELLEEVMQESPR